MKKVGRFSSSIVLKEGEMWSEGGALGSRGLAAV